MQFSAEGSAQRNATLRVSANRLNDGGLVQAAKNGHSTAFATLSDQYKEQLFRAARRITKTREDAEDAVQDTLLRAFVHMGDFEGRSNFGTWLTSITVNSALMIVRKKRSRLEIATGRNNDFGVDSLCHEIADHEPNPETCYLQNEKQRILRTAIQRLRPNLRVVVQTQLRGRSMPETANALGISLSAAKARLFHAKRALRSSVIKKLGDQPRFGGDRRVLRPGLAGVAGEQGSTIRKKGDEDVVAKQGAPKLTTQTI